jgi:hypothetical protein
VLESHVSHLPAQSARQSVHNPDSQGLPLFTEPIASFDRSGLFMRSPSLEWGNVPYIIARFGAFYAVGRVVVNIRISRTFGIEGIHEEIGFIYFLEC